MKFSIQLLFTLLLLASCDSPMNHRVRQDKEGSPSNTEKLVFKHQLFKAEVRWIDGPYDSIAKSNQLLVFIYNDNDKLVSLPKDHSLEFYSTMPSMDHPMDDAGYFEEIDTGLYINKNIRFNMGGDWQHELLILDSEDEVMDQVIWLEFL